MNIPTIIGSLVILALLGAIVAGGLKGRKKGGCGGGCGSCPYSGLCGR